MGFVHRFVKSNVNIPLPYINVYISITLKCVILCNYVKIGNKYLTLNTEESIGPVKSIRIFL